MKTLGRILIILLAAAMVIGGVYALAQTSTAQTLVGQPIGQGGPDIQGGFEGQTGTSDFTNGQGGLPGGDREGHGGSWVTVGQNLLEIAAVVAAVQVVWSIGRMIKQSVEKRNRLQLSHDS